MCGSPFLGYPIHPQDAKKAASRDWPRPRALGEKAGCGRPHVALEGHDPKLSGPWKLEWTLLGG